MRCGIAYDPSSSASSWLIHYRRNIFDYPSHLANFHRIECKCLGRYELAELGDSGGCRIIHYHRNIPAERRN